MPIDPGYDEIFRGGEDAGRRRGSATTTARLLGEQPWDDEFGDGDESAASLRPGFRGVSDARAAAVKAV
jgi:hypothetical protein